jgi:hypothetical protein
MQLFPPFLGAALISFCTTACGGDDGRTSASASASASTTTTTATTIPTEASSASGSGTGESETIGGSGSAGESTTSSTTTTPPTTTDPGTSDGSSTTGADADCAKEQPPAYQGPIDNACEAEPQVGTFNPIAEWTKQDFKLAPGSVAGLSAPIVISLNDDNKDGKLDTMDIPDVVMTTVVGAFGPDSEGVLRAITGDGSSELWAIPDQKIYGQSAVGAADVDADGFPEIFATTPDHRVKCFEHDGVLKWTSESLAAHEIRTDYPAISDMDHDGVPEVIYGRVILSSADGKVRGIGTKGRGSAFVNQARRFATSFAVDADADGVEEVVVGDAMYSPDGALLWENGKGDGFVAAGDFDADGKAEIVVVTPGRVRLQTHLGVVLWDVVIPDAQGAGGPPTVADFDGDGAPEVGIAGRGAYVVFDDDGSVLWKKPVVDVSSGITGSSVYDFEGDGVADVVYADETTLWVFSGGDGAVKLAYKNHSSGTALEYPVIADVDNDGETEIVLVHNKVGTKKTHSGVTVIGDADKSWVPARRLWNQYAYFITNVGDDGVTPVNADANWTLYNNFRAGITGPADGLKAPDLVVEIVKCEAYCVDNAQVFWVHLGNAGASPLVAGASIEIYGVKAGVETLVETIAWADVLQPGEFTAGIFVDVDPVANDSYLIRAIAKEEECKLDNNEVALEPPFCTIPG